MVNQARGAKQGFMEAIGHRISGNVQKWLPNPFLFASILTFIAYIMGITIASQSPMEMIKHWYSGFWNLLTFAMQMVLILVTGYVLAYHSYTRRIIRALARVPSTGRQAAVLVAIVAMVLSWINWGLGLIVGAIMARETARQAYFKKIPVHYPVLCAAGYTGLGVVWHWGLSASAPLLSATKDHIFADLIGIIPSSETIFSGYGLILSILSVIFVSAVIYFLSPRSPERCRGIDYYVPDAIREEEKVTEEQEQLISVADKINSSKVIGGLLALMGLTYIVFYFVVEGKGLNLNIVNFTFLFVGLALYMSPKSYMDNFCDAVKSSAGIILQFPFYAGIMGMISLSGLGVIMAGWLVHISSAGTFPIMTWLTGGLVNLFVPSGGGEWTVVGETILRAAQQLEVPIGKTIMAYAVGDAWTNLFQPFWAIPLLGITGMRARDIFGYCITLLFALVPFLAIALTVIPY